MARPILLYGSATWTIKTKDINRIQATEVSVYQDRPYKNLRYQKRVTHKLSTAPSRELQKNLM